MSDRIDPADPLVPEDIRAIVTCALDLAYYRRVPISGDLSRAVAAELLERVQQLPDHTRDDG